MTDSQQLVSSKLEELEGKLLAELAATPQPVAEQPVKTLTFTPAGPPQSARERAAAAAADRLTRGTASSARRMSIPSHSVCQRSHTHTAAASPAHRHAGLPQQTPRACARAPQPTGTATTTAPASTAQVRARPGETPRSGRPAQLPPPPSGAPSRHAPEQPSTPQAPPLMPPPPPLELPPQSPTLAAPPPRHPPRSTVGVGQIRTRGALAEAIGLLRQQRDGLQQDRAALVWMQQEQQRAANEMANGVAGALMRLDAIRREEAAAKRAAAQRVSRAQHESVRAADVELMRLQEQLRCELGLAEV